MNKRLSILLAVELLAAVALGQMTHVDRPAMARAWAEWRQHPTDETRAAFEREKRTTEVQRWGVSGVVFAVLASGSIIACRLRSRRTSPRT